MSSLLKHFFDATVLRRIADDIARVCPEFSRKRFLGEAARGLEALELMDRARHIMEALRRSLPRPEEQALEVLVRSLGPPLEATEGHGMAPFLYLPHVLFVATYGLECFEGSMRAQHALTQRFSAEFSIRAFLERWPERTLKRLEAWSQDPSPHVRRLVSEGTRPRLPWAGRLRAFQRDPAPVLRLLERLKDDPVLYVRRSVANNLNDIGKDHPAVLVAVAERWLADASRERRQLVEHALRSAVKRGDPDALRVLGYGSAAQVVLRSTRVTPPRPRIGGQVTVEVEIANQGKRAADVVLDLGVHFVKQRGAASLKIFKLRVLRLEPGTAARARKRIALAQLTTRRHHPGRHALEVRINGRSLPAGAFQLVR